mmetsp:Transcript_11487/g.16437  ORF Transcript_11487/g.16437 Transcript_11487/m.16437 type:complete len:208 (-) Transcript_11487:1860-2483(-)
MALFTTVTSGDSLYITLISLFQQIGKNEFLLRIEAQIFQGFDETVAFELDAAAVVHDTSQDCDVVQLRELARHPVDPPKDLLPVRCIRGVNTSDMRLDCGYAVTCRQPHRADHNFVVFDLPFFDSSWSQMDSFPGGDHKYLMRRDSGGKQFLSKNCLVTPILCDQKDSVCQMVAGLRDHLRIHKCSGDLLQLRERWLRFAPTTHTDR